MFKFWLFLGFCCFFQMQITLSGASILTNATQFEKAVKDEVQHIEEKVSSLYTNIKDTLKNFTFARCECKHFQCDCCAGVASEKLGLNSTICFDVLYLEKDYGLEMKITVNNYTIFDARISVRDPPPICFGKPFTFDVAEACLYFHNITFDKTHVNVCVRIEGHLEKIPVLKKELGCMHMESKRLHSSVGEGKDQIGFVRSISPKKTTFPTCPILFFMILMSSVSSSIWL